ncbi:MAG TPA: protein-export chaperone SecB [Burkholderiaceae bacterium]|jgi:preprotein translocase subunit SecB|nr:protein-export chaperone SecB [Burkholderiaceae bacterium]
MAETNGAQGTASGAPAQPTFQLQRVYLKDVSLELPNAPHIFLEQESPQVDVQLEVANERVLEGIFEVSIRVTTTAKVKDKVLFLVEAKQAGIFEARGIATEQMDAILGVVCPGIVYPYLRANIADLINRTGLPPIHLAEINFEALYQQKLTQQQAAAAQPAAATKQ